MVKQIRHKRQMRNDRYQRRFDYYNAGSRKPFSVSSVGMGSTIVWAKNVKDVEKQMGATSNILDIKEIHKKKIAKLEDKEDKEERKAFEETMEEERLKGYVKKEDEGISKKEFEAYERVRSSGVTNMFDVKRVEAYSGLKRDKIIKIMESYSELNEKYPDVREK